MRYIVHFITCATLSFLNNKRWAKELDCEVKYVRILFSLAHIFPRKDRIRFYPNTGKDGSERKTVFWNILRNERLTRDNRLIVYGQFDYKEEMFL